MRFCVAIALGGLDDAMRYVRFVRCGGADGGGSGVETNMAIAF